jgi:hypothetical protein
MLSFPDSDHRYIAAAKLALNNGSLEVAQKLASKGLVLEREAVGIDNPCYITVSQDVKDLERKCATF